MSARLIGAFPKALTYRSEKLRRAVASLPCVCCGREGMTQAAHANQGKGMGIKASDARIAALCVDCHSRLDQGGKMTKAERRAFEDQMVARTYVELVERGLLVTR
ncbi:DUF968 domain-containing protein [Burkholderia multivorans]|uniref:DUF968 domain-containing protein n=1 Tax=Burkholderia multivorans TaxID=87883 RepID=UPI000668111B|nr:DUF968 domain-containing protein [Burkholderia multivorans]MDN7965491.1 DUF968 domain-containing protein [Burkholderia multivorans]MDN7998064.1 DUF968 domain-containing protein [Burkholderia multivorans]PRG41896.1 DUF968 domain-containing protein [Burkholderia multivorans]QIX17207.1 DUF968 domain-containing protein [Burkholderia multivorans]HEM7842592.1 DUF968 domain-containing protein [Burkholderia multivorans]